MIDTIEYLCARATDPQSTPTSGGPDRLEPRYTVEFLLPSSRSDGAADAARRGAGVRRVKARDAPTWTRRSVDLDFTEGEREALRSPGVGGRSAVAARAVRVRAMVEIGRLLRVAGLGVPKDLDEELDVMVAEQEDGEEALREGMLHEELGLNVDGGGGPSMGRRGAPMSRRPRTPYEESRERFLEKFKLEGPKLQKMYDEALEDNKRDLATQGLVQMDGERRQRMVSEVVSRVRVQDVPPVIDEREALDSLGEAVDGLGYDGDSDEYDDGLSTIGQLIAIRRMSLLFNDNFERLRMEEMGRLWAKTCIVLTEQRQGRHDENAGKPFSRRIRLKKGKESGFKFSYHANSNCTVYVPVDFTDDEIIGEVERHLGDFYDLCVADDGLDDYFPSYFKDFKVHPTIV